MYPLALIDEGDHEEKEASDDKEKAKEGVKGLYEELVVQRQSLRAWWRPEPVASQRRHLEASLIKMYEAANSSNSMAVLDQSA
ncbi:hypothetical protein VNO80_15964 [Phaseolus coccineus]|uniref:Uncharacterized protein n=1 Tax=Phaseolus coccineus TaxID=3886 RepID=A0AAN9R3G1_PHACN